MPRTRGAPALPAGARSPSWARISVTAKHAVTSRYAERSSSKVDTHTHRPARKPARSITPAWRTQHRARYQDTIDGRTNEYTAPPLATDPHSGAPLRAQRLPPHSRARGRSWLLGRSPRAPTPFAKRPQARTATRRLLRDTAEQSKLFAVPNRVTPFPNDHTWILPLQRALATWRGNDPPTRSHKSRAKNNRLATRRERRRAWWTTYDPNLHRLIFLCRSGLSEGLSLKIVRDTTQDA